MSDVNIRQSAYEIEIPKPHFWNLNRIAAPQHHGISSEMYGTSPRQYMSDVNIRQSVYEIDNSQPQNM
jgi:hypothetical protein